jgi:chromosome segregation ATPase
MLQVRNVNSITDALRAVVDATAMSSEDASRLTALVQERSLEGAKESEGAEESDSEEDKDLGALGALGAPSAASYESHTGGIIETLEGLLEKADGKLSAIRKAEATALRNFEMLSQSLSDEIKFAKDDMSKAKMGLAESKETKSVAAGDLELTLKDLERDVASKDLLHHECMTEAQNFESNVKSRQEEIQALAGAKKALTEISGGATNQADMVQMSFAQLHSHAKIRATAGSVKSQVVRMVRRLAKKTESAALAQLASRMSSAFKLATDDSSDPFAKVKDLITNMISQLEAEAEAEAQHKAYCDKETSATTAKKEETKDELDGLVSKRNQKNARSVELREQISLLQKEMAEILKTKAEVMKLRKEENEVFQKTKSEMDQGLEGIRLALKILKDYYGDTVGPSGGIISLLEVLESDFSKAVAGLGVEEEMSATYYKKETMPAIELEQSAKEKDLQYKTKEYMSLNKAYNEISTDVSGVKSRLDAILLYDATIKKTCTSKPLSYDESTSRRNQEIAGLKEALTSLEGAALLQLGSSHKLRGARHHA